MNSPSAKIFSWLVALLCPVVALAVGAGSTGGLNLIHGRPIEDYVTPLEEFVGFDSFKSKLEYFDQSLPGFSSAIRVRLKKVAFYKLPVELDELPHDVTGFEFRTEQCALQPAGKDVVLISEPCLERLRLKG